MLLDILLVSALIIFLEMNIVGKNNYIIFSPFFIFLAAYNLLFILPAFMTGFSFGNLLIFSRLETHYIDAYLTYNRFFFYSFSSFSIIYFLMIRNKPMKAKLNMVIQVQWIVFLIFLSFIVKYIYLGTGLGWNPFSIIQRIIFPREFTSIKEGTGLINYLQAALTLATYLLTTINHINKKTKSSLFMLIVAGLLFYIGGGKQSLIWLVFVYIIISIKSDIYKKFSFSTNIKYILIIGFVIVLSFSLMVVRADSRSLVEKLVKYQKESYNSALVLGDFEWKSEYLLAALTDTIVAPIPRALWAGKPYIGFFKRYWQPKYEANAVLYQTSTYGFIAESHMIMGVFAPFCYAFIFFVLMSYCYVKILTATKVLTIMCSIYLTTFFYFFLRVGVTGFIVINIVFAFIVFYVFLKKLYKFKLR